VDVVGEEDYSDTKMDEVYRPSVLSIKTEHEVSIVIKYFCCAYLCLCVCFFVGMHWVCVLFHALFGVAAVFSLHWCTGEMSTC
jgi:UDP-glucose 6-dehydrogenase